MKRIMVITLVLLVILAAVPTVKLMRFELINKSNQPAYLELNELNYDSPQHQYLSIEAGSKKLPATRYFTLVRGVYSAAVTACGQEYPSQFENFDLNKAFFTYVIVPCGLSEAKSGDGVFKYNPTIYPYEDPFGVPLIYDLGGVYNWRY